MLPVKPMQVAGLLLIARCLSPRLTGNFLFINTFWLRDVLLL